MLELAGAGAVSRAQKATFQIGDFLIAGILASVMVAVKVHGDIVIADPRNLKDALSILQSVPVLLVAEKGDRQQIVGDRGAGTADFRLVSNGVEIAPLTFSVQAKGVRITPDARAVGENAPSHRVLVGRVDYVE